jgi:hypothetical protein
MGQGAKKVEQGTQTSAQEIRPDNDPDNGQFLNPGQGRQGLDEAWRPTDADQQQGNSQQMKDQEPVEGGDFDDEEMNADEDWAEDDDIEGVDEADSDMAA